MHNKRIKIYGAWFIYSFSNCVLTIFALCKSFWVDRGGRVAMIATMGYIMPEIFRFPGCEAGTNREWPFLQFFRSSLFSTHRFFRSRLQRSPLDARPFNMALVLLSPFPLKDGCSWWHWNPAPTKTRMPRDRDDEDMFFTSFVWNLRKHVGNSGTVI